MAILHGDAEYFRAIIRVQDHNAIPQCIPCSSGRLEDELHLRIIADGATPPVDAAKPWHQVAAGDEALV
jgi:hypothetical protein